MTNLKKYTNADFYKNGVFQQEIAIGNERNVCPL